MDEQAYPIPIGVTQSFSAVPGGVQTKHFNFPEGYAIVTFRPADVNNPGTATLYDSGNNDIMDMTTPGWYEMIVPLGGGTYYFKTTADAKTLAMTQPSIMR
jgi:hypothetical protein